MKIPAGTVSGSSLRLKGKGIKHLQGFGSGDLQIKVNVHSPKSLSAKETELLKELASLRGDAKVIDSLYDRIIAR